MMGAVIVIVTGGIIAIGYFLFQGLDDNSKQLNAMKVRRETSSTPMLDIVPFVERKTGMADQHPLCEKLFNEAEVLRAGGLYQKAIALMNCLSRHTCMTSALNLCSQDAFDKLHLSVRDNFIAQCYVAMNDYQKALEAAVSATNGYLTCRGLTLLADIYDHLKMPEKAAESRKRCAELPSTPDFKQNLLNVIK